jgi:hypothetical protein
MALSASELKALAKGDRVDDDEGPCDVCGFKGCDYCEDER